MELLKTILLSAGFTMFVLSTIYLILHLLYCDDDWKDWVLPSLVGLSIAFIVTGFMI